MTADQTARWTYWELAVITLLMVIWSVPIVSKDFSSAAELTRLGAADHHSLFEAPHRIFTATWCHLSVPHLLGNMCLLVLAWLSSVALGIDEKTSIVFLMASWLATALSVSIFPGVVLGASGGVFGVFGAISMALITQTSERRWSKGLVVFCLLGGLTVLGQGDWVAHLTGYLLGLGFMAVAISPQLVATARTLSWSCVLFAGIWHLYSRFSQSL